MKTTYKIVAILLSCLLLIGCGPKENQFVASYFYTGYDNNAEYPMTFVLHSTAERDSCIAQTNSFKVTQALSEYDDDFFEDHVLFVLNISMGSSGYRYEVERVCQENGVTSFQLRMTAPGDAFPMVMSGMHILVEMDNSWDCDPENIRIEYQ